MNRIRQTITLALVVALLGLGLAPAAQAQTQPYRLSDRQVGDLIRRLETSTDRFRASLDSALDRTRYDGTRAEDNINQFMRNFEGATDRLRERFDRRASVAADVEFVLQQAVDINRFVMANRLTSRVRSDWALVRSDLEAVARAYNVVPNWNAQVGGYNGQSTYGRPTRINDRQVEVILTRVEQSADRFRRSLDNALDRTRYDGTRAEDNINQFVRNFESATDQLRSRFNSRNSAAADVENVLRQATYIDDFMTRHSLARRAENDWSLLKADLNQLATAYSVAWTWDARSLPYGGTTAGTTTGSGSVFSPGGQLTGTYRLDVSRSDDARRITDEATRTLPFSERQRIADNIMRRLEAPEMLALERRGQTVTVASSRAPQTSFEADNLERREQLPNGTYSRVTAQLSGERLIVRSAGNRATDFNVTFEPMDGGRRLLVTREIWNERLGANPIIVRNYYDRTSDVAQWSVFGGSTGYTGDVSATPAGDFVISDGQMVIATLDSNVTTRSAQVGDRVTLTVREPSQFAGSTIEGRVASVNRSGRVTGRAEMSFDFDTIRLRDGRTYQFAGFVETVRTASGDTVSVDTESTVRDDSQGNKTAQRAAIGTAVGAIIGAIAGGGKGAAIGAIVGAGAGAGSVYVQGREDLDLASGTEFTIRASAPNR
ncbi:MAG TPA: YMGG-like glycine zipper-containing protein [Pyrinomonadaceae bacterium]|nr:YMGG-like glycine zipper-containing protein [Pyrinomonadaceae bacterium]